MFKKERAIVNAIGFQRLVQQYSSELQNVGQQQSQNHGTGPRLDLLEVFCGPQSQLTQQAQKLKFRAERFGYQQVICRRLPAEVFLFHKVVCQRPKNTHVALGAVFHV